MRSRRQSRRRRECRELDLRPRLLTVAAPPGRPRPTSSSSRREFARHLRRHDFAGYDDALASPLALPVPRDLGRAVLAALLDDVGYRQATAVWRVRGSVDVLRGRAPVWAS